MRSTVLSVLAALGAPSMAQADEAREHSLQVSASAPVVTVAPRTAELRALRLPELEYTFSLDSRCADTFSPYSISLAVADSRRSLTAEQLDERGATELRLTIPANQLAPIPLATFCVADGDAAVPVDGDAETLTLPATLTYHASLLCANESKREITYTSAPLDVTLICETGEDATE